LVKMVERKHNWGSCFTVYSYETVCSSDCNSIFAANVF
jgi:hypothetical protein